MHCIYYLVGGPVSFKVRSCAFEVSLYHPHLWIWQAIRGALRAMLNHSPAKRKRTLNRIWRRYSGSTNGFRLAHWSIGFLQSVFNSSKAMICKENNILKRIFQKKRRTWKMAKKMRKASMMRATMQVKAAKVKAILLLPASINSALKYFLSDY